MTSLVISNIVDLKIASKCFVEKGSGLIVDSAGSRIPVKSVIVSKQKVFIITKDEDIDRYSSEGLGVICQATDEDFNFLEAQVGELDAERNQSVLISIFRSLTDTRDKTTRRQVTCIVLMLVTLGANGPTVIPSVKAIWGMHETIVTQSQEILATTTNLGTPTRVDQEVSVPETAQLTTTANNESQLSALHLNSNINIPNSNISVCSSNSLAQKTLKHCLMKN